MLGALKELFQGPVYQRDYPHLSGWDVILWWEYRRFFYNMVVAGAGAVAGVLIISCALIAEPFGGETMGIPDPPIFAPFAILAYGVMANICYTAGWVVELLLAKFNSGRSTNAFGLGAFRLGVKLSMGLTLTPALLAWADFLFRLSTGTRAV
jgi:hypothetical protein